MRICLLLTLVPGAHSLASSQESDSLAIRWADSLYAGMDRQARIGQLFMIRAHSNLGQEHIEQVKAAMNKYMVGGLCFFQGTPKKQAELTNMYQELSKTPLLIAMDAEWGLGMRHKEAAISFPRQLMLGALQDNQLLYAMGLEIGTQLRAIGVHMNFAPVVDINTNPSNPVIHERSFGEDKYSVTAKAYLYAKGLQDKGVIACAKHFPGHGDTDVDSHKDLPVLTHDAIHLDSLELYPFKVLAEKGIGSVMVGHIQVPALDNAPNMPATLSKKIVGGILREDWNYDGLIVTDAMEMQGVLKHHGHGEAALKAFLAGADILLMPQEMESAYNAISDALDKGTLEPARLEVSVKRILRAKYNAGLHHFQPLDTISLKEVIFSPTALALRNQLIEESLTVVRNIDERIPVREFDPETTAFINISNDNGNAFSERINEYLGGAMIGVYSQNTLAREARSLLDDLSKKELVIIALTGIGRSKSSSFGILASTRSFLRSLDQSTDMIFVLFGTPYALEQFEDLDNILLAFDDDPVVQDLAAQGLMGVFPMSGRLPVGVGKHFPVFSGETTQRLFRLGYAIPEQVGMQSSVLSGIDSIAAEMIRQKAAPGCQVLVARDGRIVYKKAFGHHTYEEERKVLLTNLYDLASVTKIAGATLALMKLVDEGKIDMNQSIGNYLPQLQGMDKSSLFLKDILSHRAGLYPWIPFYRYTLSDQNKNSPLSQYYQAIPDSLFSVPVAQNLYLRKDYLPQIWDSLYASPLVKAGHYKYSDLGFYLMARLVEQLSGQTLDEYLYTHFYGPLGLDRLLFTPLNVYDPEEIVPTEEDAYYRNQRVQGFVHDMGAAMLGGVSGHAGLFGNAHDLGILMEMLLNGGIYGDKRYLSQATVRSFTKRVTGSTRRALGFDMKDLNYRNRMPLSSLSSPLTYGHTGFTGTCVWNDPVHDLVFIFLSNRTYPEMQNNALNRLDIRERVQSVIYKSMENQ